MADDPYAGPEYGYWRNLLAGRDQPLEADKPQCGFFYRKVYSANGSFERAPVAIYQTPDEGLVATEWRDGVDVVDVVESWWLSVANNPIPAEVFWDTVDNGRWADTEGLKDEREPEKPVSSVLGGDIPIGIGHNQPKADVIVDPLEELRDQLTGAINILNLLLADGIKDKAAADKLANSKDRIREIHKKADKQRDTEKRPHDEKSKAVQLRWKPLLETGKAALDLAVAAETAWLKAERTRLEAEAQAANARIEQERLAHAEAARLAAEKGEPPPPEPESIAPVVAAKPRVGGAISGRKTGLRTTRKFAIVDDWEKLIDTLQSDDRFLEELRAIAQTWADRAAAGGNPLPGTRLGTEETAV